MAEHAISDACFVSNELRALLLLQHKSLCVKTMSNVIELIKNIHTLMTYSHNMGRI